MATLIDKKTFIKEKLNNFILFAQKTFGPNNVAEFLPFADIDKNGPEFFLKGIVQLAGLFEMPMDTSEKKANNIAKVRQYLAMKNLATSEENMFKMLRYLEMFLIII